MSPTPIIFPMNIIYDYNNIKPCTHPFVSSAGRLQDLLSQEENPKHHRHENTERIIRFKSVNKFKSIIKRI